MIVDAIRGILNQYGDARVRNVQVEAMQDYPEDDVFDALRNLLPSSDDILRTKAFDSMFKLHPERAIGEIVPLFNDSSWHWMISYISIFFADERTVPLLCKLAKESLDNEVVFNSVNAIGNFGKPENIETLDTVSKTNTNVDYEGRSVSDAAKDAISKILARYHT